MYHFTRVCVCVCVCVCVFTPSNVNVDLSTDWKYIIFFVFCFFVDFFFPGASQLVDSPTRD